MFAYCGNNPVARKDDGGTFWNFVIGGVVGGLIGAATSAISSYKETGEVNLGSVLLGAAAGAIGGVVGASGLCMAGQAAVSAVVSAGSNIVNSLIKGQKVDWASVAGDALIGAGSSLLGSAITKRAGDAAKNTINKGINKVLSGFERYHNGSRYWKGAVKRGMSLMADGVHDQNFARGCASVIGSEVAGIATNARLMLLQMVEN